MNLVYPIYLDTPMMTAFLASLEGAVIEQAEFETKSSDSKEKSRSGSLGAKASHLLSSILDVEGKGEAARKVSEKLESQYKSTIKFPHAALFIRLRELMIEQGLTKKLASAADLNQLSTGDIVEFEAAAKAIPSYQIRRLLQQLLPILDPLYKLQELQLDGQLAQVKQLKPIKAINKSSEQDITQEEIKLFRDSIEHNKQSLRNQVTSLQHIGQAVDKLFPEEGSGTLLFESNDFSVICRVYNEFTRNEKIQDVIGARWHCLGKVIGTLSESDSFDLFQGSAFGYLPKGTFQTLAQSLNSDEINVELTEPHVKGPAIILAVLAIFA